MPVNLSQIRDLLLPGLWGVSGKYQEMERQWAKVFEKTTSNMALERRVAMRYLGLARVKDEGAPTAFDNAAGQRYVYNAEHREIGLAYAITRKAIADNLYKSEFGPSNDGLRESFLQTQELYGADIFNAGTTYNATVGGDGKALFASDHPIDDGVTIANRPTVDVDLNETSLLNASVAIRQNWKDQAGLKIYARAKKLLVPNQLEPTAVRLYRSDLRPGTANNDVNAVLHMNESLKEGYMVWDYLTSNFAWFLTTNTKGLVMFEREPFETDMSVEFTTDNLLVKGYERYSFAHYDWRSVYGSFPTA